MGSRAMQKARRLLASGRVVVVIQCGGRGHRAHCTQPKPLVLLAGGDRPLTNVLRDIPRSVPVYLHVLADQVPVYMQYLCRSAFPHRISYLTQQDGPLLDENGRRVAYPDGTQVVASNGPATFVRRFAALPAFFCILDGAKVGVCSDDVVRAVALLLADATVDAVVFVRALTECEIEGEQKSRAIGHTRYARVSVAEQKVYEHPVMPAAVVTDKAWLALTGMYVVRAQPYQAAVATLRGQLMPAESVDTLYTGYTHVLKVPMTLKGYNGRARGLAFATCTPSHYIPGIKTPEDIKAYGLWKKRGVFGSRRKRR